MKPPFEDYLFICFRLDAKEAYKTKKGGDLNQLQSYSIRQYRSLPVPGVHEWSHTAPKIVDGQLRRTVEYGFSKAVDPNDFKRKVPVDCSYLVAKKPDGSTDLVKIFNKPRRVHPITFWKEMEEVERLNRPIYKRPTSKLPKNKRLNAFRAAVRQSVSTAGSSSEELKTTETSQEDKSPEPKKPSKENSKHQGKSKTFKRKTKRRGRV